MSSRASHPPLRWTSTSTERLSLALDQWAAAGDPQAKLDLRANAYGFGAARVAALAKTLGLDIADPAADGKWGASMPERADHSWVLTAHAHRAMALHATVINAKEVPAGAAVSYGGYYTTAEPTTLALVAIGFADGIPRVDPIGGEVEARGQRFPIAGRIAMDQLIIDTGQTPLEPGDTATVWGGAVGLDEWSAWSNRPIEVLSASLGERVVDLTSEASR